MRWSVDASLFQNHFQTRWVGPMNCPTLVVQHWLGHIESIAFGHNSILDVVSCSLGHLMLDHASPRGRRGGISEHILLPEAVRISDIAFVMVKESFVVPAIFFYLESAANKR
jgi:hypothetical protein